MKKKAIEQVPFLGLPEVNLGKMAEYVAMTAVTKIGGEEHLLVEVYRNQKEQLEIPVVRIALTQKDFGTFFPEESRWSRGKITGNTWDSYGLIWREGDERIRKTGEIMAKENILRSPEDLKRIRDFLKNTKDRDESRWWWYIAKKQEDITSKEHNEREKRKRERREQALKDRMDHTQELPKRRILEYADKVLFYQRHCLYYKKRKARATVACSRCGAVTDARWKPGQSYESQFERQIKEPKMGAYGTCPVCGKRGQFIAQGKAEKFHLETKYVFLGQRYKEEGMVFRYVKIEKEWQLELLAGEKGLEMQGATEGLYGVEIARAYLEPGKKIQRDYQKHNPYDGKDFWDDCNLSGLANINVKEAHIMPETFANMKETFLRYSALEEYQRAAGAWINPVDYLERYMQTPQLEMLVKLGLTETAKELVKCRYGIVADEDARRIETFLGIRKEHVRKLIQKQGETGILQVMQAEKRLGQKWTGEQIEKLEELDMGYQISTALEHMGVQKFLNRVSQYAGCQYGTGCSIASKTLRDTARTYIDYLNMRQEQGYDLQNTVYLFPKSLEAAHAKMVMEQNQAELDQRIREVARKFPLIKKHYRRLRNQFYFEDEEFLIRPARDAGEIVMEGRFLHHCVGGDSYLRKHNEDQSTILFLRLKEEPEIPYITVEIETKTGRIRQWYGAYDKKPDKDRMQSWLDAYATRLSCAGVAAGEAGTGEPAQELLACGA